MEHFVYGAFANSLLRSAVVAPGDRRWIGGLHVVLREGELQASQLGYHRGVMNGKGKK